MHGIIPYMFDCAWADPAVHLPSTKELHGFGHLLTCPGWIFLTFSKRYFSFQSHFVGNFKRRLAAGKKIRTNFSSLASFTFTIILDWLKWVFGWWRWAQKKVSSHELGRSKLLKFHSKVVGITRVTRWQDHFFNVWLFTTMNTYLPNSLKMSLGKFQSLPKSK